MMEIPKQTAATLNSNWKLTEDKHQSSEHRRAENEECMQRSESAGKIVIIAKSLRKMSIKE